MNMYWFANCNWIWVNRFWARSIDDLIKWATTHPHNNVVIGLPLDRIMHFSKSVSLLNDNDDNINNIIKMPYGVSNKFDTIRLISPSIKRFVYNIHIMFALTCICIYRTSLQGHFISALFFSDYRYSLIDHTRVKRITDKNFIEKLSNITLLFYFKFWFYTLRSKTKFD